MRSPPQARPGLLAGAWLGAVAAACVAAGTGCGLRQLAHDDLFGPDDAAAWPAADAVSDRNGDRPLADGGGPADATPGDAVVGTGMLSGVVSTSCSPVQGLDAKVGIAGHHKCSYPQKGSFFFSDLPLGTLELAVAKEGYVLYQAIVVIAPGGTVHNVALTPASPGGCADPLPVPIACDCTEADCLPQ